MSEGRWNKRVGWVLLTLVFTASAGIDPWLLSQRDPGEGVFGTRLLARHAQAVVIGMAFLQLLVGRLLAWHDRGTTRASWVAVVSILGAVVYSAAHLLLIVWPAAAPLAAVGASLNLIAFVVLLPATYPAALGIAPRVAVVVLCGGMVLDGVMALSATEPGAWGLGPIDGVPMRMLRLARAAMIALSLISLLFAELHARARPVHRLIDWAAPALVGGAAGMPLLLVLAAGVWVELKYLLGLPAYATIYGVLAAIRLAARHAGRFELVGWVAVAASMGAGLLMGMYAFDGPVPDPSFIGAYNDYPRRLTRLGHAYLVVFGLMLICLHRDRPTRPLAAWLVAAGAVVTASVLAVNSLGLPPLALGAGPALVAAGLAVGMPAHSRWARR